jgi:hypothetical protein
MNLKVMDKTWNITFTHPEGGTRTLDIKWIETAPTEDEAALAIRDIVLGDILFLVDQPRESRRHTVTLLEHHGYKITKIEKG